MESKIHKFVSDDYAQVSALLAANNLGVWKLDEYESGIGYVCKIKNKIVGFAWAMYSGKVAYFDCLVVAEGNRQKHFTGRSEIGLILCSHIFKELSDKGCTLMYGLLVNRPCNIAVRNFCKQALGMVTRDVLTVVKCNPETAYRKLEVLCGR